MTPYVSLRHLRAFITVAELGSVTRAAEALFRAQSAITRSIHELETVIGESLFERKSSGMLLTVFGTTLLFRAKRAAQEFELARDEIASKIRISNGPIKASIFSMLFNERRLQTFVKLAESHHMPTVANALGIKTPTVNIVHYSFILPFMQALRQSLMTHIQNGGRFNVITPSQIYFDCLLENLSDVSDQSDGSPGGIRYIFSFIKPIITLQDANKILNDVATKTNGGNING